MRLTRGRGVPLAGEALGIGLYHSNARTAARNSAMCTALMTIVPAVSVASVQVGADCPQAMYACPNAVRRSVRCTALARAVHLTDLRTALGQAYIACGQSAPTCTDATLTAGTMVIKAVHIAELRAAVLALE